MKRSEKTQLLIYLPEIGDIICLQVKSCIKKKNPRDNLGYECRLSLINPSYIQLDELTFGLKVEGPDLILNHNHLRDANLYRYCLKEPGTVKRKSCHVYKYCSDACLEQDYVENRHWVTCEIAGRGSDEFSDLRREQESWPDIATDTDYDSDEYESNSDTDDDSIRDINVLNLIRVLSRIK